MRLSRILNPLARHLLYTIVAEGISHLKEILCGVYREQCNHHISEQKALSQNRYQAEVTLLLAVLTESLLFWGRFD